jgi:hypothetical protein
MRGLGWADAAPAERKACNSFGVMRGLDPRIHDALPFMRVLRSLSPLTFIMDCRVKPGNDN